MSQKTSIVEKFLTAGNYLYRDLKSIPLELHTEYRLRKLRSNASTKKTKILGVWDFHQLLQRAGDFIAFLEMLSVLQLQINPLEKKFDLCFIDDPTHYNADQQRFQKSHRFKKVLKNLSVVCPFVDSVFLFSSNEEFERFYVTHKDHYQRWPASNVSTRVYDCRSIEKHYLQTSSIPRLTVSKEILAECGEFYQKHVFPRLPIVINIRQNIRSTKRNTPLEQLETFLQKYSSDSRFMFIIICNKEEFPKRFRKYPHVLFSKDFFQGVEYDLALVDSSYLSIFPSSGMSSFAWFSTVPFIQHGPHMINKGINGPDLKKGFSFFTEFQRFHNKKLESSWLLHEFEDLVSCLESSKVNNCQSKLTGLKGFDYLF